jgi:hypothetical protein
MLAHRWKVLTLLGCGLLLAAWGAMFLVPGAALHAQDAAQVSGVVVDADGPVARATVRVQATNHMTHTASNGTFTLGVPGDGPFTITAWANGYFVGWAEEALAGDDDLIITLRPYYTTDNAEYDWFSLEGAEGSKSCSHCMPSYNEWETDAHAQSAVNPRFITMYNGTDVHGNQSPPTRYGYSPDYGRFPLRPDPSQPYYGPGYKLDFPESAGNCATCHVPAAAAYPGAAYTANVNDLSGIEVEGVFCEFCHKIGSVTLDPNTGLPYPNMPGTLSMQLHRPEGEQQLFLGNFDDVTRRVSYLPLIEESAFCAPCHYGVFWDTVVYNSYGEWLDSPYSNPVGGQTCQDCHMLPVDYDYFVYPDKGGLHRDSALISSHYMPGAADEQLLQNTAEMTLDATRADGTVTVDVSVTNTEAGHHIPTDSPLRQIFVLVMVTDAQGRELPLQSGPTLPDWAGDLAGEPGVYFAKILEETWTEIQPSGAYWLPTTIVEDTRLAAFETSMSNYTFTVPADAAGQSIQVEARLVFRRAFYELMQQKDWDAPDILMEQAVVSIP